MREKLIADDVIECVLGLGPNLFYNSPMEACVVVCRTDKPKERRGRILFLNAVAEVTRERAQSFLTDDHLSRIVDAYRAFENIPGFAHVATNDEVLERDGNLSIPLYVRAKNSRANGSGDAASLNQILTEWQRSSEALRKSMSGLFDVLEDKDREEQTTKSKPPVQPAFKRAVLAAEVVSALHREPTFGSVKHEKVVFLCEKHLGLDKDLEHHHLRQAAGPYDPKARRSIENNFKKLKWFDTIRKEGRGTQYIPLEKSGGHDKYFENYFGSYRNEIDRIINLMRPLDTERCEIIATLYSAWSDFLDGNVIPTDDQTVDEVLQNWHPSKRRISRERWTDALGWMKEKGLAPRTSATRVSE